MVDRIHSLLHRLHDSAGLKAPVSRRSVTRLTPFYGYPAEVIAQWCCVSIGTAKKYKNGQRKPSKSAMHLFELYRDGRILDDAWNGYRCVNGQLWDNSGKSVRPGHFQMLGLLWHALSEADNRSYRELLERFANIA